MTKVVGGTRRRPLLWAGLLLVALAVAFWSAYAVIGSDVDADGFLHEPFALIPLAWVAGILGVILVGTDFLRARRNRR